MIRFGPSGNSDEFYEQGYKHTYEAMQWLYEMGLNAFEYSFGRGVRIKKDTAKKIKEEALKYNIALSVHAQYYINLASDSKESREKNIDYMLSCAKAAKNLGAVRMVVHPGSCSNVERKQAMDHIKPAIVEILGLMEQEGYGEIYFCPETMGRVSQIGSLEEVMEICRLNERIIPAIDFGHLYARSFGGIKSKQDFVDILDTIENALGFERLNVMHCHFSKIEYSPNVGEKKHLTFDQADYGPDYIPLIELMADKNISPVIICESRGTMAKDALSMKNAYEGYKNKNER